MDSAKVLYCSSIYIDGLTEELTGNAKFFETIALFFSIVQYIWTYSSTDNVSDTNITYTNLRKIFKKI